jgi:putative phosphoribosyl transferase
VIERDVNVVAEPLQLPGHLVMPDKPDGIVIFAHGSGSSRHSPRNQYVARVLNLARLGTLLFDLLTTFEEPDRANVFDIELLAGRLVLATRWLASQPDVTDYPIGFFGASTGAAAALWAAADLGSDIKAVVSRGGRPDLARPRLADVRAATLLVVGGRDPVVLELNLEAQAQLRCEHRLELVPGASHLFEERGTLDRVAELAADWFKTHFTSGVIHS